MDFANAGLLIAAVFGGVELVKRVSQGKLPKWATPLVAVVIGIAAVFLIADSVWAKEQVIGEHGLDSLNASSKLLVGFMVGFLAVAVDAGLVTAVKNIGQNQPAAAPPPPPPVVPDF